MRSPDPGPAMRLLLALLAMVLSSACGGATQTDVVGRWALSEGSRQNLPADLRDVAGRLDLQGDGTFIAVDLPEKRTESSGVVVFTRSGRGTWKTLRFGGRENVELFFADGSGSAWEISSFLWSEPKLYYFVRDPDSGGRLELGRLK